MADRIVDAFYPASSNGNPVLSSDESGSHSINLARIEGPEKAKSVPWVCHGLIVGKLKERLRNSFQPIHLEHLIGTPFVLGIFFGLVRQLLYNLYFVVSHCSGLSHCGKIIARLVRARGAREPQLLTRSNLDF